jgi:SM-20-related protein
MSLAQNLKNSGYSFAENIFDLKTLVNLKNQIQKLYHNNSLREAGISQTATIEKNIRGDLIYWLSPEKLSPEQKIIWDFLENSKNQINEALFLGIKEFEAHVTLYPPNGFYQKHRDQFKTNQTGKKRVVSFILYLNSEWKPEDGGELLIYDPKNSDKILEKITPNFGKMVFFLSSEFDHEVLPTKKERMSLTGWFYQY